MFWKLSLRKGGRNARICGHDPPSSYDAEVVGKPNADARIPRISVLAEAKCTAPEMLEQRGDHKHQPVLGQNTCSLRIGSSVLSGSSADLSLTASKLLIYRITDAGAWERFSNPYSLRNVTQSANNKKLRISATDQPLHSDKITTPALPSLF